MRDRYTSALSMPPPLLNSTYCLYTYTHTCGAKGMCTKRGSPCLVGPFFFFSQDVSSGVRAIKVARRAGL